jgi:hypothetical protein
MEDEMEITVNVYSLVKTIHQHGVDHGMKIQKQFDEQREVIKSLNLEIASLREQVKRARNELESD